jgi:hypothetical protein
VNEKSIIPSEEEYLVFLLLHVGMVCSEEKSRAGLENGWWAEAPTS